MLTPGRKAMMMMAGVMASERVKRRRIHGRMRQCMKPSITTCPARVPVMVLLWPLANRAMANRMLAAVTFCTSGVSVDRLPESSPGLGKIPLLHRAVLRSCRHSAAGKDRGGENENGRVHQESDAQGGHRVHRV